MNLPELPDDRFDAEQYMVDVKNRIHRVYHSESSSVVKSILSVVLTQSPANWLFQMIY